MFNEFLQTCIMSGPDQPGATDLAPGDFNIYTGNILDECEGFQVRDYDVPLVELSNTGSVTWVPEFVRVFFDDGVYVECPAGEAVVEPNTQVQLQGCQVKIYGC